MNNDTLLKPGDQIRIRKDIIYEDKQYKMYHDEYNTNSYVKGMAEPGSLITIIDIAKYDNYMIKNDCNKTDIFSYTDEMFDPETIKMLLDMSNE
jgi:hypothetical protein